jgi:hypothetical protein
MQTNEPAGLSVLLIEDRRLKLPEEGMEEEHWLGSICNAKRT